MKELLRFSLVFVVCFSMAFNGLSQKNISDSVFTIDKVDVKANRLKENYTGGTVQVVDSSTLAFYRDNTLASLLTDVTGASVRAYGPAGLSSVSIRGGGAAHTAVIWNGINLQSPMNGGVNLSTIPMALTHNVSVQYGGSGTLYGSGNLSGAIHLSGTDLSKIDNQVKLGGSIGSFGSYGINVSAKVGDKKQHLLVSGTASKAQNDFEYTNSAKYGSPKEKQTNAQSSLNGASADYQLAISDVWKLNAAVLYSGNDIHVPTRMTDSNVNAETQSDRNVMSSVNLRYITRKGMLVLKNGYMYNQVLYLNPSTQTNTDNHSRSLINELEWKHAIDNCQSLDIGINQCNEKGASDAYGNAPVRNRLSLFAFYKLKIADRLEWTTSLRQEASNSDMFPLVYASGIDININRWLAFKSCASKTYRIPTFNDLYWSDAFAKGNPYLLPETGFTGEASLVQSFSSENRSFTVSESVFANSFKNWIVWLPNDVGTWTPTNKDKGVAKGIECRANWTKRMSQTKLMAELNYTYTHSTITSGDSYNQKPMIYVPDHKVGSSMGIDYRSYKALLQINYTGKRYYDSSNTLDPYVMANLHLTRSFKAWDKTLDLTGHVYNINNANYQVMAWYAMPLRHYSLSITISI
jgi:vitamin B12 transporter